MLLKFVMCGSKHWALNGAPQIKVEHRTPQRALVTLVRFTSACWGLAVFSAVELKALDMLFPGLYSDACRIHCTRPHNVHCTEHSQTLG